MRFRSLSLWVAALAFATLALFPSFAAAAGLGAASPRSGELDLFLRHDGDGSGNDPNADSLVMLPRTDGVWRSPVNLGGFVHKDSEISATSRVTGEITVAVRWNDNSLRTRTWTDTGGWANGWNVVASNITGGPSVAGRGASGLLLTWRSASGKLALTTGQPGGPWSPATELLSISLRDTTGPSVSTTSANPLIAYTDASWQPRSIVLNSGGNPLTPSAWGAPAGLTSTGQTWSWTTPSTGVVRIWAATNGNVYRYSPPPSTGGAGTYNIIGGSAAGAANARPGESTLPNTPTSLWSNRLTTGGYQADAFWRTQDGCITTRTKTSSVAQTVWTTPSPSSIPAHPGTARCVWPARVGTLPLMKRIDGTEYPELSQADQSWRNTSGSTMLAQNSYVARDQTVVYHQGPDWPTSWSLRNWHPNPWVYRKSTAYQTVENLHTAAATQGYFVRRRSNGRLVALGWGCSSSGCPQPLLNVTSAAARSFWLYGSSTSTVNQQGNCIAQTPVDGIVDLLSCTSGPSSSSLRPANPKGVWLDDVLPHLTTSTNANDPSLVADLATGKPLTNAEVTNDLPFTAAQWADGLATEMEQLRGAVNTLKAQKVLRADQGKLAINYKWTTYGFGSANIAVADNPYASRILRTADIVELEGGWIDAGVGGGGPTVPFSFQRRQQFVDQVHAIGPRVLEEVVTCAAFAEFAGNECTRGGGAAQTAASASAHNTVAQYNAASTLLNYASGDMVGDIADYYGRAWDGYSTELGVAIGGRTLLNGAAGPQQRLFERGRVIVVPPGYTGNMTFSVPVGSRWRPTGSNTLTTVTNGSITLAPRRGAILLNP